MSAAEQDAAAATANADDDDKDVEAELFGEDDDDKAEATEDNATSTAPADPANANAATNATAPAPTDPKAEEAAPPATSSFSIPKKDAATATASTATASTPALTSPAKHSSDGNGDASPRKTLSDGGGGGDSDGPQLPDELVVPDSAKQLIADDRSNRLKALLLKLPVDQMNAALEEYDEAIQQKKPIRNHIGYLTGVLRRYLSIQERTARPGDGGAAMGEMTAAVKGLIQTKLLDTGFCTEIDLDEKIVSKLKQLPERDAMAAVEEISRCARSSIRNFPSYFMGILHRYMRGERDGSLGGGGGGSGDSAYGRRPPPHHDDHHRGGPPPHRGGPDRYGGGRDDRDRHHGRSGYDDRGRDRPSYDRRGGRYERDRSPDHDRRRDDRYRDRGRERDRYDDRRDRDRSPDDRYGGGRSRRRYSSRSRSRSPSDSRSPYGRERKFSRDEGSNGGRRESRWGSSNSGGGGAPPGASPIAQSGLLQYGPSGGSTSWGPAPPQPPPQRQLPVGARVFAPAPAPVAPPVSASYYGQQPPAGLAALPAARAYSTAAPYGQIPGVPPPALATATRIPGVDLANLASQAQQALSSIQALPGPPVAAVPASLPMQAQQLYHQPQHHQQAEMVTESDLPLMVQYALTNLKTTGHIEAAGLDPGVCRMLKNVPEHAALSALEKFQSCDTSLMRNKNSYLAGIIKRKREENGLGAH